MSEGAGTPNRQQIDKSTAEGEDMADSHEELRRELLVNLTTTFRLLKAALADLPIPIGIDLATNPADVDQMIQRARDAVWDELMPEPAKVHLDMAILAFASAFDVIHVATHRDDMHWRYDAGIFLLGQADANMIIARLHMASEDEA
jgi:hypothetical protein